MFANELEAGAVADFVVKVDPIFRVHGWAATSRKRSWGYLACHLENKIIAYDVARRYDAEAKEKLVGYGWCGYLFDLSSVWANVKGKTVRVSCMKSGRTLFEYDIPGTDVAITREQNREVDVSELLHASEQPESTLKLESLGLYADAFIASYGHAEFVCRAYDYILERAADSIGLETYVKLLAEGGPPSRVLTALYFSEERYNRPRRAISLPGDPSFPFYPD